jgi:hypothetical protein
VLSNPSPGASLGSPAAATVRIADDDLGISFESTVYTVGEQESKVVVGVARRTDAVEKSSVEYVTVPLTATEGVDYTPSSGTLSFAPGETLRTIHIPILNDGLKEPAETFQVRLMNPSAGAFLADKRSRAHHRQ